jgi:hypothetical protein
VKKGHTTSKKKTVKTSVGDLPVIRLLTWASINIRRYPIDVAAPATKVLTEDGVGPAVEESQRNERESGKRMAHPSTCLHPLVRNVLARSLMVTPIEATFPRASSPPLSSPCLGTPVLIWVGTGLRVWSCPCGEDALFLTQASLMAEMDTLGGAVSCQRKRGTEVNCGYDLFGACDLFGVCLFVTATNNQTPQK